MQNNTTGVIYLQLPFLSTFWIIHRLQSTHKQDWVWSCHHTFSEQFQLSLGIIYANLELNMASGVITFLFSAWRTTVLIPKAKIEYLTSVVIRKSLVLSEHFQDSKGASKNGYDYEGNDPQPSSVVNSLPGIFASLAKRSIQHSDRFISNRQITRIWESHLMQFWAFSLLHIILLPWLHFLEAGQALREVSEALRCPFCTSALHCTVLCFNPPRNPVVWINAYLPSPPPPLPPGNEVSTFRKQHSW